MRTTPTKAEARVYAFVGVVRIAPDEERLVLSKPVVQLIINQVLSYWLFVISLAFLCFAHSASAFAGVGRIAPDEERFVL